MINPEKILVACLSTGEIRYIDEAMLLFKTLNAFGGTLSKAKKIACFTKNIDEVYKQKLSHLGVQVKIIDKLNSPDVMSSRIQALTLDEDYEFLVALDTDMIVTNDFSKFLQQDSIGVPIEDDDLLSIRNWKDIFQHFNIEFPKARVNTAFTNLTLYHILVHLCCWFQKCLLRIYTQHGNIILKNYGIIIRNSWTLSKL